MMRPQVGDEIVLGIGGDREINVHVTASLGWAELLEVEQRNDPVAGTRDGVIAAKPDGSWWWVRRVDDEGPE